MVSKADKMIPRFVQDVVGHITGMPGVFISCVFSASLSTVSANLNALAGVVYMDFIKPMKAYHHTERKANLIMKTIIVLLGIECALGALIVEKFSSIFQMMNTVAGTSTGAIFGVFTVGMLYPWANKHVIKDILLSIHMANNKQNFLIIYQGALYGIIISIALICMIIINTQIAIGNNLLHYEAIPTSIEGCSNGTILAEKLSTKPINVQANDEFAFYKISFMVSNRIIEL